MPQVTVFVRNDDLPKWKAVEKKSEFMHKALIAVDVISDPGMSRLYTTIATKIADEGEIIYRPKKIIKTPKDVPQAIEQVIRPSTRPIIVDKSQKDDKNNSESQFQTCKAGHPADWRGKCFDKKCKYSK